MACSEPETAKNVALFELDLLSPEEKQRFESHLIGCDECFQNLYKMAPVASLMRQGKGAPRREVDLSELEAGDAYEEAPRESRPVPRLRRSWAFLATGAAAAAVAAFFALRVVGPGEEAGRLRGPQNGSIVVFAPVGEVPPPSELQWKVVPGARGYEVRIHTPSGELIWKETVKAPPAALPEPVREALVAGETYFWQVEALTPEGTRETSGPTRFMIRDR